MTTEERADKTTVQTHKRQDVQIRRKGIRGTTMSRNTGIELVQQKRGGQELLSFYTL
jgi:hypothetical protein